MNFNFSAYLSSLILYHEIMFSDELELNENKDMIILEGDLMHSSQFWDIIEKIYIENDSDTLKVLPGFLVVKKVLISLMYYEMTQYIPYIDQHLNIENIKQQIMESSFDYLECMEPILNLLSKLCAPIRDRQIKELEQFKKQDGLVVYLRNFYILAYDMKDDMNQTLTNILKSSIANNNRAEYEKEHFLLLFNNSSKNLVYTALNLETISKFLQNFKNMNAKLNYSASNSNTNNLKTNEDSPSISYTKDDNQKNANSLEDSSILNFLSSNHTQLLYDHDNLIESYIRVMFFKLLTSQSLEIYPETFFLEQIRITRLYRKIKFLSLLVSLKTFISFELKNENEEIVKKVLAELYQSFFHYLRNLSYYEGNENSLIIDITISKIKNFDSQGDSKIQSIQFLENLKNQSNVPLLIASERKVSTFLCKVLSSSDDDWLKSANFFGLPFNDCIKNMFKVVKSVLEINLSVFKSIYQEILDDNNILLV